MFIPSPEEVRKATADGLSIVCATCRWYWKARQSGIEGHQCAAQKPCHGPISGGVFPEYDGPITDFANLCFVCGKRSRYGIAVKGNIRVIGVCDAHLHLMKDRLPGVDFKGKAPPPSPKTLEEILMGEDP